MEVGEREIMDTSKEYTIMCRKAVKQSDIGKAFKQLPSDIKLGTQICFRFYIGMIRLREEERDDSGLLGISPETLALRTWTEKNHDLTIVETGKDFDDEGFPLFRQDQLQKMVMDKNLYLQDSIAKWCNDVWSFAYRNKQITSMEQLWLAFVMKKKYSKVWNGVDWK